VRRIRGEITLYLEPMLQPVEAGVHRVHQGTNLRRHAVFPQADLGGSWADVRRLPRSLRHGCQAAPQGVGNDDRQGGKHREHQPDDGRGKLAQRFFAQKIVIAGALAYADT